MVLAIAKYDIHPDKMEAYLKWADGAVKRNLAAPGVVEFRAYRTAVGASQVVTTYEFADLASWAAWFNHPEVQKTLTELHTLALNVSQELWGPSPLYLEPIRPAK